MYVCVLCILLFHFLESERKTKILMNSNDVVFAEIRDVNFVAVAPLLLSKAKSLLEMYSVPLQSTRSCIGGNIFSFFFTE
jgi:hypothetical protein